MKVDIQIKMGFQPAYQIWPSFILNKNVAIYFHSLHTIKSIAQILVARTNAMNYSMHDM